jgi:hypothetical protein
MACWNERSGISRSDARDGSSGFGLRALVIEFAFSSSGNPCTDNSRRPFVERPIVYNGASRRGPRSSSVKLSGSPNTVAPGSCPRSGHDPRPSFAARPAPW